MPDCKFCFQPTNYTYRDSRISNHDMNLVNYCSTCSANRDYLSISSIFGPKLTPIIETTIKPIEPAHDQYLNRPRNDR